MNPLQSRKQLLLAESELNRAQLAGDIAALKADVCALTGRARSIGLIASSAAALLAALSAFRRGKPAPDGAKTSWLPTLLKGAGLISTLWMAWRPGERAQKNK
jgi:hypothetical protein